tara:strand:- start:16527 stop:17561 length:1035 start_codon:yes stop_codon:yes gene_type:complete
MIKNKEKHLTVVGIFRVSGVDAEAADLLSHLDEGNIPDSVSGYELSHAIKYLLKDKVLMSQSFSRLGAMLFKDVFLLGQPLEELNIMEQALKLKLAVIALCESVDMNEKIIGEILYRYFHLATRITDFSDVNKMDARNMGLMLGPVFINNIQFLPIHYDQEAITRHYLHFNCISEVAIGESLFRMPFEEVVAENALSTWKQVFTDTCDIRENHILPCDKKIKETAQKIDFYHHYLQNIEKQSKSLNKKTNAVYLDKIAEDVRSAILALEHVVATQEKQLLLWTKQAKEQDKYSDSWLGIANSPLSVTGPSTSALTPAFDQLSVTPDYSEPEREFSTACQNRARF